MSGLHGSARVWIALCALALGALGWTAFVSAAEDIVFQDFEQATWPQGWTTTGDAFGDGPAEGTLPNQQKVAGYNGDRLVSSFHNGDAGQGTLTSPVFTISRRYIQFVIGGGNKPDRCGARLLVDDAAVRTATGNDSEVLQCVRWEVSHWAGKPAQIEVFDRTTEGWGHIMVDYIVFSDGSPPNARPPIVFEDFEKPIPSWRAEGDAFSDGPVPAPTPTTATQFKWTGWCGDRLVSSLYRGAGRQGTLTSPTFTISRGYMQLLVGGGNLPGRCEVRLLVDGQPTLTAAGRNTLGMARCWWNVSQWMGRRANIQIVDLATDCGIFVDDILFTDDPFDPAIMLKSADLPPAAVGLAYAQRLVQLRGVEPATFALKDGQLPEGLALSAAGEITGIPKTVGQRTLSVLITDANGCAATAECRLRVGPAPTLAAMPAPGGDWPQWRGPNRNGVAVISPPLASAWPAAGPSKLWEAHPVSVAAAPYAGGHSSPVVAGGRVYEYVHDKGRRQDIVLCLDASTGATLWTQAFSSPLKLMHGASATPCVANGRVYIMGGRNAYCLDAETGVAVWTREPLISNKPEPDGYSQEVSSSFVVTNGVAAVMIFPCTGLDAGTGKTLWTTPESGGYSSVMTSPVVWSHAGKDYLIYCGQARMCCVDPVTGAVVWEAAGNGAGGDYTQTPAILDDRLVCYWRGKLGAYRLSLGGPECLWEGRLYDRHSSALLHEGRVYFVGRQEESSRPALLCHTFDTGERLWERAVPDPEFSSPVLADGKILLLGAKGKRLVMVAADSGALLAEYPVNAKCWASLAVAFGRIYVRLNDDGLACYDLTAQGNTGGRGDKSRPLPLASYCEGGGEKVEALCDGIEPTNSRDFSIPYFSWFDHRGTAEWVGYDYPEPRTLSRSGVYWLDEQPGGNAAVPESWRVVYWDGAAWQPVQPLGPYGVKKDCYNWVTFRPVKTTSVRLEVQLKPNLTAGILEWKAE